MLQVLGHFMSPPAVERTEFMVAITATVLAFALLVMIVFPA